MGVVYSGPTSHRNLYQTSQNVLNTVGSYAQGIDNSEENYLNADMNYLRQITNVAQVFGGDYDNNRALSHLNDLQHNNKAQFDTFLNDIGMNEQKNAFNNFVFYSDVSGNVIKGSDFKQDNILALQQGKVQNIKGIKFDPNDMTANFNNMAQRVANEAIGLDRLNGNNAHKLSAYADVKSSAIKSIQSFDGLNNFSGTHQECRNAISSLNHSLNSATNPTQRAKIEKQLNVLRVYDRNFSQVHVTPRGFSNAQKSGFSTLSNYFVGGGMTQGVNTYRAGAHIGSSILRGTANVGRTVVMKVAQGATFGADFAVRHIPIARANVNLNNLTKNARATVKNSNDKMIQRHKENLSARRNHTTKDLRFNRKIERIDKRTLKKEERFKQLTKKRNNAADKAFRTANEKDIKKSNKLNKKTNRYEHNKNRRLAVISKGKTFGLRLSNSKFGATFSKMKQALGKLLKPANFMSVVFSKIFGFFNKAKLIILSSPLIFDGIIIIFLFIYVLILKFASAIIVGTDLVGALTKQNYCQLCVDKVEGDLASDMLNVFKSDANHQYNVTDAIPSDNYDWYKRATDGKIGNVVASEDNSIQLPSINSNIAPILSMMHCRYTDYINYDQYPTCQAYMYYMYVKSHRVASKQLIPTVNCSQIYSSSPIWDEETHTVDRGEVICSNEYLHGYQKSKYTVIAEARITAANTVCSVLKAINLLNLDILSDIEDANLKASQGVWHNEIPQDSYGECTNYTQARWDDKPICGIEEHTHSNKPEYTGTENQKDGCWGWIQTEQEEETTTIVACKKGDSPQDTSTERWHSILTTNSHEFFKKFNVITGGHWEIICGKDNHTHTPWSESDHGCYGTAYICNGHCGGHITPVLTIEVDTDYETLMKLDTFATPMLISADSFNTLTNELATHLCRSYDQYQAYWDLKMLSWNVPGPWSMPDVLSNLSHEIAKGAATVIDGYTKAYGDLLASIMGVDAEAMRESERPPVEVPTMTTEDMYDFEGWTCSDGTINEQALSELISFYGEKGDIPNEYYKTAKQRWLDIGEVIMSDGMGRKLTTEQISDILNELHPASTVDSDIVKKALETCGQYWLNEQKTDAVTQNCGAANRDSWVRYILKDATNKTLEQFDTKINASQLHPGCIIQYEEKPLLSQPYTHYAIYLGELSLETVSSIPLPTKAITKCRYLIDFTEDGVFLRTVDFHDIANIYD